MTRLQSWISDATTDELTERAAELRLQYTDCQMLPFGMNASKLMDHISWEQRLISAELERRGVGNLGPGNHRPIRSGDRSRAASVR